MPTQLTIPQRPQFGVGQFEPYHVFHGAAGLRWAWESSFGGILLPAFEEAFTPFAGGGVLGVAPSTGGPGFFTDAGNLTLANITKAMSHTQHPVVAHYTQHAFLFDGLATAIKNAAAVQVHAKKHVEHRTKPRKIIEYVKIPVRVNLRPLRKATEAADARARKAERENLRLRKRVANLEHTVKHLRRHAAPVPAPVPGIDLPGWGEIKDRLKNPAKWLGLGAFLALLVKSLPRLGVNYIRCRNNKRWGAHVCREGENFLGDLIAATSLLVGTYSLIQFARMMQAGVGGAAASTKYFWQVK